MLFDVRRVEDWINHLRVTQGEGFGRAFELFPWQRRFLRGALDDDSLISALSVARGAGKTTFVAAIGVAAFIGPMAVYRGEVQIVASTLRQGMKDFDHCLAFLQPVLEKHPDRFRTVKMPQPIIEDLKTGMKLTAWASTAESALGGAPSLVIAEEPAAWGKGAAQTGIDMYNVLETSLGKIPGSRMMVIGTRSANADHWFERLLQGGADYAQMHAARPTDPLFHARTWHRANPSLKFMPARLAAVRKLAAKAKDDPDALASFKHFELNMGTPPQTDAELLSADLWESVEGDAETSGSYVLGLDLGGSVSQSAAVGYWPLTGAVRCIVGYPATPNLSERGRLDAVGNLYQRQHDRGELVICGLGRTTDVSQLLDEAVRRWGRPAAIAADRYRQAELLDWLERSKVPRCEIVWRGYGWKDGNHDIRALRRVALDGPLVVEKNLALTSAVSEARLVGDVAGNVKLARGSEAGRRQKARDDAAAALIVAVSVGESRRDAMVAQSRPRRVAVV